MRLSFSFYAIRKVLIDIQQHILNENFVLYFFFKTIKYNKEKEMNNRKLTHRDNVKHVYSMFQSESSVPLK